MPTGDSPVAVAAADFNADGRIDLAVSNGGSDTVSVLVNQTSQADLVGTTLFVYGTPLADMITVSEVASLRVVVNGSPSSFSPSDVRMIRIYGNAGNDAITVNSLARGTALTAFGGDHDDVLTVRNTVTTGLTLFGGNGNDTLSGGGGNDQLIGGSGNDSYFFDTDLALGIDSILDGGGTDTLNFSATTTRAVSVDLSNAAAQVVNRNLTLSLSAGDTLENVIGGARNDMLIGNSLANTLKGGDGDDVLSGRAGNDILVGGPGKNILIGGFGNDQLTGGSGEDLLLGARYLLEDDSVALNALRAEWSSSRSYNNRVGHLLGTLSGGANIGFTLTSGTVKEDNAQDSLIGGSGRDWYFGNFLDPIVLRRDVITDRPWDSVFTQIGTWL
jgi:Ca2+-binding RTX toxin-like protein